MILIYVTCKDKAQAEKIAKEMIKSKLACCTNIFPVESIYNWEGKLQKNTETVLILKSLKSKFKSVEKTIKKMHSYKMPFIGKINVKPNKEYEDWAKKELR